MFVGGFDPSVAGALGTAHIFRINVIMRSSVG